jgi:hypothetical protein
MSLNHGTNNAFIKKPGATTPKNSTNLKTTHAIPLSTTLFSDILGQGTFS